MMNLLDKLNNLKLDNKKILLIVLAFMLMLYVDFMFVLMPQLKGISAFAPKISKLKTEMNNFSKDSSLVQDFEHRQKSKSQKESRKAKEIISEDKILLLLQEITDIANKNKIKVTQINTSKDAKALQEVVAGEKLLPVLITMGLNCSYHSLGSFINELEGSSHFIQLQDMKIMRDPRNYLLENASMVLKTYVKK